MSEGGRLAEEMPSAPPFIRTAIWDDVKAIKKIASSHKYTKHFSHPAYCNRSKFNNGEVLVSVIEDEVIGFVVLRIRKRIPETEIDIICVDPEWRSKGIGKQLVDYVCKNQNNPILVLSVHKDNEATKFYLHYGFVITGTYNITSGECWRMRFVCKTNGVLI